MFLDGDLNIRKFTPRIAEVFGLLPHDIGRKINVFSPSLRRASLAADFERVLRRGAVCEERVQDSAGTWFFLRILPYRFRPSTPAHSHPLHIADEPASVNGVVMTLTDITTLEQTRSRLALLSAIVDSSDDAITAKSLDGILTTWNGGAERLYGYSAEEAVGRSVFAMMIPADKRAEEEGFLARIARDERVDHVETVRLHKDGRPIDVSVTMSPIKDEREQIVGISAIARDVTQLVGTRRQLEERQERIGFYWSRWRRASTASTSTVAARSATRRVLACSASRASRSLQARSCTVRRAHGQRRRLCEEHGCPLHAAVGTESEVHSESIVLTRADGSSFPWSVGATPARRRQDRRHGRHIPRHRRTQAREGEIVLASRRREGVLAMLSHELRNPLAAVLAATRVLGLSDVENSTSSAASGRANPVDAHGALARRLARRRADHSAARSVCGARSWTCATCAQSAVEALRPLFVRIRRARRATRRPAALRRGDPDRLQQIHSNLLGNASVYSPNGSRVILEVKRDGDFVVSRVKDSGIGISPELLPSVFELFVQGEQRLDRPRGGLGIGLTLVQTLVKLHGGSVEAKSEGEGRGSELLVRLPLSTARPSIPTEAISAKPAKMTVLLIEDHDDGRELMRTLLETKGYDVSEACEGTSGLEALEAGRPDVAIIDIGLPGASGYEIAKEIRSREHLRGTYLIAMTGYGQDADIARAREAGFDQHLTKPVDFERLEGILARRR